MTFYQSQNTYKNGFFNKKVDMGKNICRVVFAVGQLLSRSFFWDLLVLPDYSIVPFDSDLKKAIE